MTLTTYGYKLPETGDLAKGADGWFQQLEFDIERLDGHTHDGVDSSLLPLSSFSPYSGTILAANWAADGAGYKQTVTVPAGVTEVNDYNLKFIFTAPVARVGEVAYLAYDRQSATTYEVYCNDNTAAFTVVYR
jgi:hypothetical protein